MKAQEKVIEKIADPARNTCRLCAPPRCKHGFPRHRKLHSASSWFAGMFDIHPPLYDKSFP